MISDLFTNFEITNLFDVLAGIIAFFVAYLQILPLIPRSSAKILSDIEVLNKATEASIDNVSDIKIAIEREIRRKYKKPTRIYNFSTFFMSLFILIIVSYFLYDRISQNNFDTTFYFLILLDFMSFVFLTNSFDEPIKIDGKNGVLNKTTKRTPVFYFEIFSWYELISGMAIVLIFGFWTHQRFFKTGRFDFDWWAILTFIICCSGIGNLTGAFKKKK